MTVYSFEGVVNLGDPVVWITIATVSYHLPFGYAVASMTVFWSPISFWASQGSVLTREGPLASSLWMTTCQRNAWREERAVRPQSLDHRLEKAAHPLPKSEPSASRCHREAMFNLWLFCYCDPGDAGRTSSKAAASHTPQTLTPQLFPHVCDHFLKLPGHGQASH